jgi:hypothetical protein
MRRYWIKRQLPLPSERRRWVRARAGAAAANPRTYCVVRCSGWMGNARMHKPGSGRRCGRADRSRTRIAYAAFTLFSGPFTIA